MKPIFTAISIGILLLCGSALAKVYTFDCPTPTVIRANVAAHGPNPAIYFGRHTGWGNYPWMPPELGLSSALTFPISKATFISYQAVLFGQEVRCIYQLDVATLQLRLTPSAFYSNPKVGMDGNPHEIQLDQ